MLSKKELLTQNNLNSAYISKTDTNDQSVSSNISIQGGVLTLKDTVLTDSANVDYFKIDPQGNKVVIYDGVNDQELKVYSSSGTEFTQVRTINGETLSYGLIDVGGVDHLKINTNSGKNVVFGGNVGIGISEPSADLHVDGIAKLSTVELGNQASSTTHAVRADRNISTGNGLSGGGNLTSNRTLSVVYGGTNGNYGTSTSVARSDHTHDYLPLSGGTVTGTVTATTVQGTSAKLTGSFVIPVGANKYAT
ncbi:hypothetical protein [Chengkuizengella axinellae]|uniref:Uncharacterized protein n=1 Tax=Chengkuizengella axinellae TaxID=3064388 RepID=A0ABT9IY08_9BACL|nr:hypothetical protein [Chengkuizengella sp. 2205SS18-9]MDP5273689.1 hypothetical protein [Chengkuizengella sp. 2205SS18-9]